MIELEFLGRSGDAHSVIFTDADGERYRVAVTDELRTAVRRDPIVTEGKLQTKPTDVAVRPAEIQAMLREGQSAAEIADQHGVPLDSVLRWESPIQAEKAWAVAQAKASTVGNDPDSPLLEDLVINRLAARGVDHNSLSWTASRHSRDPWEVTLTFIQGAVERTASWSIGSDGSGLVAIDEEANWLTETASGPAPVSAFPPPLASNYADADSESELAEIESLLDRANSQRGRRQPILDDYDSLDEDEIRTKPVAPFFAARVQSDGIAAALAAETPAEPKPKKPSAARGPHDQNSTTAETPQPSDGDSPEAEGLFEVADETAGPPPGKNRGRRRSVPSWDEIVFGTRTD